MDALCDFFIYVCTDPSVICNLNLLIIITITVEIKQRMFDNLPIV